MKTVFRWAGFYVLLLAVLTLVGGYNYQKNVELRKLLADETRLTGDFTRLTEERYEVLSPLALRQWAEENGYIPMSLARWERKLP